LHHLLAPACLTPNPPSNAAAVLLTVSGDFLDDLWQIVTNELPDTRRRVLLDDGVQQAVYSSERFVLVVKRVA